MTEIYALLIAAIPALTSILSIIAAVVKVARDNRKEFQPIIDSYNELKKEIQDKTNLDEARNEMKIIIEQNAQLREQNNKLIQALTRVVVQDDKEV